MEESDLLSPGHSARSSLPVTVPCCAGLAPWPLNSGQNPRGSFTSKDAAVRDVRNLGSDVLADADGMIFPNTPHGTRS